MDIKFNEQENSIEINDGLKTQYFAIVALLIINIINAAIHILLMKNGNSEMIGYIWILLGLFSFGILVYQIFKKSRLNVIPIERISLLREKSFLAKNRYSLELKNGKIRDLNELKKEQDISEMKKMFSELGVKIS